MNPWRAMFNAAWLHQAIHGTLASYVVTGFAVAGVYAWLRLRGKWDARSPIALKMAMGMAMVAIVLQIIAGDFAARRVHDIQPVKFAALEGIYETEEGVPFTIGGIPRDGEIRYGIRIPNALSLIIDGDPNSVIAGLDQVEPDVQPNVLLVRTSFQVMVGAGFAMLGIAAWYWIGWWRKRRQEWSPAKPLLYAIIVAGFLSIIATQAGWFVTEFGRQPWVVVGFLHREDAVTDRSGVAIFFYMFLLLYIAISVALHLDTLPLAVARMARRRTAGISAAPSWRKGARSR